MADHAESARKSAQAAAKAPAAGRGAHGEILNRRNEAALAGRARLLARRADTDAGGGPAAPVRDRGPRPIQPPPLNRTGMPDRLKAGVERLSGLSMDDVRVHRSSSEPARLGALAYAQGRDIHLGAGQERHLPHEAWHVVQQKQGRVRTTARMTGGTNVNDDPSLEREADMMGVLAARGPVGRAETGEPVAAPRVGLRPPRQLQGAVAQLVRVPVGFDRVGEAANPNADTLVTTKLSNCIAVAAQDRHTRRAVMGHFNTGLAVDHAAKFQRGAFLAFRHLLEVALERLAGAAVDPQFHVALGGIWLRGGHDVNDREYAAWLRMKDDLVRVCSDVFRMKPTEAGSTAEFSLAQGGIKASGIGGVEKGAVDPPENESYGTAGDEINYDRLRRRNPSGHKLDRDMTFGDKASIWYDPG